jgi:hypothetical protein
MLIHMQRHAPEAVGGRLAMALRNSTQLATLDHVPSDKCFIQRAAQFLYQPSAIQGGCSYDQFFVESGGGTCLGWKWQGQV